MKNVGSRVTALIVMLILCAVVGIYRLGWFDVSFLVRPAESTSAVTDTDTSDSIGSPDSSSDVADSTDAPELDTSDTTEPTAPPVTGENELSFISYSSASEAGYSLSYEDWVSDGSWTLAVADVTVPSYFSSGTETVYEISHTLSKDKTTVLPVYTPKEQTATALKLYMGYIITETDREGRMNIYTSSGKLLGSYDADDISPAWCRDAKDRPLFSYKDSFYYIDEKRKRFVEADYDPDRDLRGACFDYTPDYGDDSGSRKFNHIIETVNIYEIIEGAFDEFGHPLAYKIPTDIYRFSLANNNGSSITEYKFYGKYAFSDGISAVIDEDGHMYFINRSGRTLIKTGREYRNPQLGRRVIEHYMEPVTNGTEAIGFYFFEHGLCRVRKTTYDKRYYDTDGTIFVVGDEDVLIFEDGSVFPTPTGYDIISYSDGMILLEKDGKYGYMSYTGEWIVDPSLSYAEPFYEGLAVVGLYGKRGLIDTNGELVIPYGEYSYISHASTGLISVYGEDGWQVLYKCKK